MNETTTDLLDITLGLGKAYTESKQADKQLKESRRAFFAALDDLAAGDLEERLATACAASKEEAIDRLERMHPAFEVDDIRQTDDGRWEAILVERRETRPMAWVNSEDGTVYSRQVQQGPVLVDDERLLAEEPELYGRVTTVPYEDWLKDVIYHCGVEGEDVDRKLADFLEFDGAPSRTLRNLDDLSAEDLAGLQEYIYRGPPIVKLGPPRKAKPEELGDDEE